MADYYTPTVIDPTIPLADMLPIERQFLAQVFSEDVDGENAYYYSNDGASDFITLDVGAIRDALDAPSVETCSLIKKLLDQHGDTVLDDEEIELDGCDDLWAGVLQDIVSRSPDLDHLTVTMAFTCSKMRPDGFGGLAMLITASTIRSESTHTLFERFYTDAAANGEINHGDS